MNASSVQKRLLMSEIDLRARGVEPACPADDLSGNGPRLPDASQRRVCIPVVIREGRVQAAEAFGFPALKDTPAELFVPAHAFANREEFEGFAGQTVREALPAGEILLCRLGWNRVPMALRRRCKRARLPHTAKPGAFVEIVLDESLRLRTRGTKLAVLLPVNCHIPALKGKKAESLNEAYGWISTVFEPGRRSRGGSTFLNIYYFEIAGKRWRPLDDLRGGLLSLPQ